MDCLIRTLARTHGRARMNDKIRASEWSFMTKPQPSFTSPVSQGYTWRDRYFIGVVLIVTAMTYLGRYAMISSTTTTAR